MYKIGRDPAILKGILFLTKIYHIEIKYSFGISRILNRKGPPLT